MTPPAQLNRRTFLKATGTTLAAAAAVQSRTAGAAPQGSATKKTSENYVKLFHESLTETQREFMHFPFDHPLRKKIANNWDIVDKKEGAIGKLYTSGQQEILRNILQGLFTEDGYKRLQRQMQDDAGGFEKYTCALFGNPGEENFEWVFTGRHSTLRADGNSVKNTAFGGPIFYGHAVEFNERPDHPGNVWWHQARLANKVYESLDGQQREKALLDKAPPDSPKTIILKGQEAEIPGLPASELSADQKEHLEKNLKALLDMFRPTDVEEVMQCLKENGGIDTLRLAYYKKNDLGDDGIWDLWRIEGPAFIWHFRGAPHVHTWVNIAHNA